MGLAAKTEIENGGRNVMVKKAVLRGLMRLKGLNPTYNRFTGTAVVEWISG